MKRFLAVLLALAMICCLAACGPKPADNTTNPTQPKPNAPVVGDVLMGLSVADVNALVNILAGGESGMDLSGIKNVYIQTGASQTSGFFGLGANLNNKQYDVNLFMKDLGEAYILSAPALVDKNYGFTMEGLMAMMEEMTGAAGAPVGAMGGIDPELAVKVLGRYYEMLLSEIKKANGITVDGTTINGELNAAAAATIVSNLINAVKNDDEVIGMLASTSGLTVDEFKAEVLEGLPAQADLEYLFSAYELKIQFTNLKFDEKNVPRSGKIYASVNQEVETEEVRLAEISVDFDFAAGKFNAFVKDEGKEMIGLDVADGKLSARFDMDGATGKLEMEVTESAVKAFMEMDGQKVFELNLTFSDTEINLKIVAAESEIVLNVKTEGENVTGTLTMDGQEMGKVTFIKKVEGTKTTLTLGTLTMDAVTIDFAAAGISFFMDTDAELPTAPESYTDITTLTEDELNGILDKFMTDNAELIEWLSELFPTGGEAHPDEGFIDMTNPEYAA